MSKAIFQRVQEIFEITQATCRAIKERQGNIERQLRDTTGRLQTLEGQVAVFRAAAQQAQERRTSGDHGNSGN